jgi:hypothetical protein
MGSLYEKLTPRQRKEIARKAAKARWEKKRREEPRSAPTSTDVNSCWASREAARKGDNVFCAVLIRRLKEGASFEDFRKAWEPEPGHFGGLVRVTHARRIDDEREIVSFSLLDISAEDLSVSLERVAEGERQRHERIADVIETTVAAGIYEVIAEVELS